MLVVQLIFWLAIAAARAIVSLVEGPQQIEGPIVWTGPVNQGEKPVTLHGDAKAIHRQILSLNPHYFDHHEFHLAALPTYPQMESRANIDADNLKELHITDQSQPSIGDATLPSRSVIHARNPRRASFLYEALETAITCSPNTTEAYIPEVIDLIKYLASLHMNNATDPATTHSCRVAAGPGKCAAIAKKKGTRVWLCNDNTRDLACNCNYLASYARDILYKCKGNSYVKGQFFNKNGYNVVIGAWNLY